MRTWLYYRAIQLPTPVRRGLKRVLPSAADWTLAGPQIATPTCLSDAQATRLDVRRARARLPLLTGPTDAGAPIEIFTPWQPTISGIATYSQALAQSLQVFRGVGIRVSHQEAPASMEPGVFTAQTGMALPDRSTHRLYMLGNGLHHQHTWRALLKDPGVVLLHDVRIPDVPLAPDEDGRWARMSHDEMAAAALGRLSGRVPLILVHTEHARDLALDQFERAGLEPPAIMVLTSGHPVPHVASTPRRPSERVRIGTLGFQTWAKDPQTTYAAIARACRRLDGVGIVCGDLPAELRDLLVTSWLREGNEPPDLHIIERPGDEAFEAAARQLDLTIQLRTQTNGESSGVIQLLAGWGVPSIVTDIGSFSDLPDCVAQKLPLGSMADAVADAAVASLKDRAAYEQRSRLILEWAARHSFDDLAIELCAVLDARPV